jgi:hypothetical protein
LKLPDANLLLYALDDLSPHHGPARAWLDGILSGVEPVGFSWVVILAFIRVSTRVRLSSRPLSVAEALDIVEGWLAQPCAQVVEPSDRHVQVLRGLLEPLGTAGDLSSDAHLAALAIEYGGEVCSADNDFARFPGVRWVNPLV